MAITCKTLLASVLVLVIYIILPTSGIKCYNCIHMRGSLMENPKCQIGAVSNEDLKTCDSTNIINGREMQAVKIFSPEAEFKFICMKTRMNAGELDFVIRGCYAQDLKKTSAWTQGSQCQSPRDDQKFWKDFTSQQLSQQKSVNRKDVILDVCGCYDRDGCNSTNRLVLSFAAEIILMISAAISIFYAFN